MRRGLPPRQLRARALNKIHFRVIMIQATPTKAATRDGTAVVLLVYPPPRYHCKMWQIRYNGQWLIVRAPLGRSILSELNRRMLLVEKHNSPYLLLHNLVKKFAARDELTYKEDLG